MADESKSPDLMPPARIPLEDRSKPQTILHHAELADTGALEVEMRKMQDIEDLLWLPARLTRAERDASIIRAMDLFESINPTEGIEAMLALQMVGTHHAAMECLRRAMLENQSERGLTGSLGHAQKLMALYANQMAALDKHRGKGQQQVTVKHVHVGAGGQAIVGDVNAGAPLPQPNAAQAALSAPVEPILPPVTSTLQLARVPRP